MNILEFNRLADICNIHFEKTEMNYLISYFNKIELDLIKFSNINLSAYSKNEEMHTINNKIIDIFDLERIFLNNDLKRIDNFHLQKNAKTKENNLIIFNLERH